jgi:hypothetical protein
LRILEIDQCADLLSPLGNFDLAFIEGLNRLRVLKLSCRVTRSGLERINRLRNLRSASIVLGQNAESAKMFAGLRGLVHLQLSGLGIEGMPALGSFTRLASLTLRDSFVGSIGSMPLPSSLRDLDFLRCETMRDSRSRSIEAVSQVRRMRWSGSSLYNLDFIDRFRQLESLTIQDADSLEDLEGIAFAPQRMSN